MIFDEEGLFLAPEVPSVMTAESVLPLEVALALDPAFSLSSSLYIRNLPDILDGDQETPSVHLLMPDISSIKTNILPDTIK